MTNILHNALWILRILEENGTMLPNITAGQLKDKTGLDDTSFDSADDYLLQGGYLRNTGGGLKGLRWLTPQGIEFLEKQMSQRIRLSSTAERIVRYLFTSSRPQNNAAISRIKDEFDLEESDCQNAARELIDEGLAEDKVRATNTIRLSLIGLTPKGRSAIRNNFVRHQSATIQHNIGANFYGPVSGSNVLAVAQAHQSRVQQVIEGGDIAALRDEIGQMLTQVLNVVKEELTIDQLAVYESAVKDLQTEISKDVPNSSIIQKCLNVISFAGDLDGTIELGQKAIELALKVGPFIPLLQRMLVELFK